MKVYVLFWLLATETLHPSHAAVPGLPNAEVRLPIVFFSKDQCHDGLRGTKGIYDNAIILDACTERDMGKVWNIVYPPR